ncbi:unnamed protein product, partial [marine sediment metagenome]
MVYFTITSVELKLFERYITEGGTLDAVFDERWFAQTFTIGNTGENITHYITSVKLLMRRVGTPGWFNVYIRATDESGHPTGENLSSGTYDGDTLPTITEFIEITLTPYMLIAGTKYAIIVENSDHDGVGAIVEWRRADVHGYTGGVWCYSTDYGASWGVNTGRDFTFYEFGYETPWIPLDIWNISLSNLTISEFIIDTWEITLSNTTQPYILDIWNISLSNLTISEFTIDQWNITLSNTSFFLITNVTATPSEAIIDDVTINITCNVTSPYAIVNVTLNMTEGTYDMANIGDTLPTITEFIEITLTPYMLIAGTKYA